MSKAAIGGPRATPRSLILLYNAVIVPRCSFSIPSVTSASRHGRMAPIPIVAKERTVVKYIRLFQRFKAIREVIANMFPKTIIHFIKYFSFPIIFPMIKEVEQRVKRGMATIRPRGIPFMP